MGGRDEVQHRHRLSSSSASPSLHRREGWECTEASQGEASWAWEASWTPLGQQHLWSSELREKSIRGKRDWFWITQPSPEPAGQMTSHTHSHIRWHTYKYILTYSYAIFRTITHLHMHVFVCLVFLEAMLLWRNLYNPNFFFGSAKVLALCFPHFCATSLLVSIQVTFHLCVVRKIIQIYQISTSMDFLPRATHCLFSGKTWTRKAAVLHPAVLHNSAPETHSASTVVATSFTTNQLTRQSEKGTCSGSRTRCGLNKRQRVRDWGAPRRTVMAVRCDAQKVNQKFSSGESIQYPHSLE